MPILLPKVHVFKIKMDEFPYFQFINDDENLLAAEESLVIDFPEFSVNFLEELDNISSVNLQDPHNPESTTNNEQPQEVAVSQFHLVSNDAIKELKSMTVNKNTSRSTRQ